MNKQRILTFTSDFGLDGGYVAACEAVIATAAPGVRICHVWHEVPAGDVAAGALTLRRTTPFFPPSTHLAVVDPGVGTPRRPLSLVAGRGDVLVGPDNGLLPDAADALGGIAAVIELDPDRVQRLSGLEPRPISSTFHGRDIFAPAAALSALGTDPALFGRSVDPLEIVRLPAAFARVADAMTEADVVEVDRFGNVGLALRFDQLPRHEGAFVVHVTGEDLPGWDAKIVHTYGDLRPGELGIICDSWGQAALALNGASAAQLLTIERGNRIRLTVLGVAAHPDPGRPPESQRPGEGMEPPA
jgi:S-adenosylmethionine hydrolase